MTCVKNSGLGPSQKIPKEFAKFNRLHQRDVETGR
jgi:hypothetical protein